MAVHGFDLFQSRVGGISGMLKFPLLQPATRDRVNTRNVPEERTTHGNFGWLVETQRGSCSSVNFLLKPATRVGTAGDGDLVVAVGCTTGGEVRMKCRATFGVESSVPCSPFLL